MVPGDYAPPPFPSPEQQRDALRKGLGRAVQWAAAGRLDDELLLKACLRDQRFDWDVDDSRGEWLWQLIRSVGAAVRFRVPILHALYDLSNDSGTAVQLCELARGYASAGDEAFRTRLYEIVEQKPIGDCPWLAEGEVVGLDGEQGFLFAARLRGRQLRDRAWEWDDDSLVDFATERIGEGHVAGLLQDSPDEAIRHFRESWLREKQRKGEVKPSESHRERLAAIPVEEVVRAAEGEGKCYWLLGWGKHAAEADLQTVLRHLWTAREPNVITSLLRVFSARALPEFDCRLIEICGHDDEEIRKRAFAALRRNAHPLVREFALSELQKGVRDGSVISLFVNNYSRGDEQQILEALELPDDACELHWLLFEILEVLKKNPEADASRTGLIAYALTLCTNCRFFAARLLFKPRVAPGWLTAECHHDANEDCRKLVENTAEPTREN
jgi:hypothetical protein